MQSSTYIFYSINKERKKERKNYFSDVFRNRKKFFRNSIGVNIFVFVYQDESVIAFYFMVKIWLQNGKKSHFVLLELCNVHIDCGNEHMLGWGHCISAWTRVGFSSGFSHYYSQS